jgi:hypothetical protein
MKYPGPRRGPFDACEADGSGLWPAEKAPAATRRSQIGTAPASPASQRMSRRAGRPARVAVGPRRVLEPARVVLELALLLLADQVRAMRAIFWTMAGRSSSSNEGHGDDLIVLGSRALPAGRGLVRPVGVAVDVPGHAVEVDADARLVGVAALVEEVGDRGAVAGAELDAVLALRGRQTCCGQEALEAGLDVCLGLAGG